MNPKVIFIFDYNKFVRYKVQMAGILWAIASIRFALDYLFSRDLIFFRRNFFNLISSKSLLLLNFLVNFCYYWLLDNKIKRSLLLLYYFFSWQHFTQLCTIVYKFSKNFFFSNGVQNPYRYAGSHIFLLKTKWRKILSYNTFLAPI